MEYFNFLISNRCNNVLNKEIGKCLVKFPTNLTFWKIAAYNEFENNFNSLTARNLFQKCIRLNSKNINAYLDYFVFEIKFAEKIAERKNILINKKENSKLKMLDDVITSKEDDKEDNPQNYGDIENLSIPQITWKNALQKINPVSVDDKLQFHFQFLTNLEKYSSNKLINPKPLEEMIIQEILNLSSDIRTMLKVIITKSLNFKVQNEKFDFLFKEISSILCDSKNHEYNNYIIYSLLKYVVTLPSENNNNLDNLIEKIKDKIDIESLRHKYYQNDNIKILSILTSQELISKNVIDKNLLFTIDMDILKEILTIKNKFEVTTIIPEVFESLSNLKNQLDLHVDLICEIISLPLINQDNIIQIYIGNVCKLISNEISYYLNPTKASLYFESLITQIESIKGNGYDILKYLYLNIIEVLMDRAINAGDESSCYKECFELMRTKMSKKLIPYDLCVKQIIQKRKFNEDELKYIK